jgi:pimeloyl-ACP methyl ester carboxylesterase
METADVVTLRTGRRVGVPWFGAADGFPVLRLHGIAGSGTFEVEPAWTTKAEVRMITVERPGFGSSEFAPMADLVTWATDVEHVADALRLDCFALFAESAGVPHGLAAARLLPERVVAMATVGGPAPAGVPGVSDVAGAGGPGFAELARQDPAAAAGEQRRTVEQWHRDPLTALAAMVSGPDADVLAHPDWGADLVRQVADGTRCPEGSAWDRVRVNRPWGFDMGEVGQPVSVWHGACDGLVPVDEGRWLADRLPGGRLHLVEAQGHWLLYPCWRQVIDDLLSLVTT